jgi:hypothetical protein
VRATGARVAGPAAHVGDTVEVGSYPVQVSDDPLATPGAHNLVQATVENLSEGTTVPEVATGTTTRSLTGAEGVHPTAPAARPVRWCVSGGGSQTGLLRTRCLDRLTGTGRPL